MKLAQTFLRRGNTLIHRAAMASTQRAVNPSLSWALTSSREIPMRSFASQAQTNLVEILAREEKEEKDTGNMDMPQDLADMKSALESSWRIVDEAATTNFYLKDKKVQVSFHCQDIVEEAEEDEELEEDDDEEESAKVRFCVTTNKGGKTLVISCVSEYGEATIEGVSTTSSDADAVHANQGNLTVKAHYEGPEYLELAEDLQEAFAEYLETECAVDSDFATFVAMWCDYKEQMQYVQFLKDAQSVIN